MWYVGGKRGTGLRGGAYMKAVWLGGVLERRGVSASTAPPDGEGNTADAVHAGRLTPIKSTFCPHRHAKRVSFCNTGMCDWVILLSGLLA